MIASPVIGESVSVVDVDTAADGLFDALFGKRDNGGGTHSGTREEGIAVEQDSSCLIGVRDSTLADVLETVTGANHEDVAETVLQTNGENVAGVRVSGEGTGEGETVLSIVTGETLSGQIFFAVFSIFAAEEQQVVRNTDGEQRGHLKLSGTHIDSLLEFLVRELRTNGETVTGIVHRQTDVLQGDTDFEVLELTGHILDTSVDGETSGLGVGNTLVDDLDADTTLDEVVERLRVVQTDVGQCGAESTQTALGLIVRRDGDVTEVLAEEREGDNTEVFLFAEVLGNGHRVEGDAAV